MEKRSRKRRGEDGSRPAKASPRADLRTALAGIEARLERLEHALDTNTSIFSDGIKMLEVQQEVSFRILEDVFNGAVRVRGMVSSDDGIARAEVDVQGYIRDHLTALTRREEAAKEAPTEPLIASVDDERPIEFGGDLG